MSICHPFIHSFFVYFLVVFLFNHVRFNIYLIYRFSHVCLRGSKFHCQHPLSGSSQPLVTPAWGIPTPSSGLWMHLQSCTQIYIQPHTHTNTQSHTHTHTSHIHVICKAKQIILITFWVVSLNCHLDTQLRRWTDPNPSNGDRTVKSITTVIWF